MPAGATAWCPPAALPDLLAAERALGRLDQMLDAPEARRCLAADAARRETLATLQLDGIPVRWDDFLLATIDPGLAAPDLRPALAPALSVWRMVRAIQDGPLRPLPPADGPASRPWPAEGVSPGYGDILADAWSAVAEAEAWLAAAHGAARSVAIDTDGTLEGLPPEPAIGEQEGQAPAADGDLEPLSAEWLAALWEHWVVVTAGRGCSATPAEHQAIRRAAALIEEGLALPGVAGAAAALGRLHTDGALPEPPSPYRAHAGDDPPSRAVRRFLADRAPPSPAWRFARLLAPFLLRRACALKHLPVWVSPAFLRERHAYRHAAAGPAGDWTAWFCRTLADAAKAEAERLATLRLTAETWERRLGSRRRSSRAGQAVHLLFERPAVTVRIVQQTLGTTFRGAQLIVDELVRAGILREVTARRADRVFVADDLR